MKIAILAAMDKELQLIKGQLSELKETEVDGLKIHLGRITGHEIFLTKCGIGKVNSAINAYKVIDRLKPDLVINSGVAGGAGLPIGTILVADKAAYHDVWCGPSTEYGEADGCPLFFQADRKVLDIVKANIQDIHLFHANESESDNLRIDTGLICSGDKFISSAEEIHFIRTHFPDVRAVDMESASIAQTCYLTGTPFNIIRVVSDTPGEGENLEQYKDFWAEAPLKTFSVVKQIISLI